MFLGRRRGAIDKYILQHVFFKVGINEYPRRKMGTPKHSTGNDRGRQHPNSKVLVSRIGTDGFQPKRNDHSSIHTQKCQFCFGKLMVWGRGDCGRFHVFCGDAWMFMNMEYTYDGWYLWAGGVEVSCLFLSVSTYTYTHP